MHCVISAIAERTTRGRRVQRPVAIARRSSSAGQQRAKNAPAASTPTRSTAPPAGREQQVPAVGRTQALDARAGRRRRGTDRRACVEHPQAPRSAPRRRPDRTRVRRRPGCRSLRARDGRAVEGLEIPPSSLSSTTLSPREQRCSAASRPAIPVLASGGWGARHGTRSAPRQGDSSLSSRARSRSSASRPCARPARSLRDAPQALPQRVGMHVSAWAVVETLPRWRRYSSRVRTSSARRRRS